MNSCPVAHILVNNIWLGPNQLVKIRWKQKVFGP